MENEVKRRINMMRKIYPQLSEEQALRIDIFMVREVGNLLDAIPTKCTDNELGEYVMLTTIMLMYLKSNVDEVFRRAMGA